jgi:hypothetical protein
VGKNFKGDNIAIVTCGNRVFIGGFTGEVGAPSVMGDVLMLVELMQLDPRTQQPFAAALDFRKPCAATGVPKEIRLVPDTVQVLDPEDPKEASLIQNYEMGVDRICAADAGVVAPTMEDIGKSNFGKA